MWKWAPLLVLGWGALASAAEPSRYQVSARVDASGHLRGTLRVVARVGEEDGGVRFWLYGDRLSGVPRAMDDRNARWVFPREVDLSDVHIQDVRVDGEPARVSRRAAPPGSSRGIEYAGRDLFVPASVGEHVVTLRFSQRLPERFGRLGRIGDRLTLVGPWYPLVLAGSGNDRRDEAYAFDALHEVRLCAPDGYDARLGGERGVGYRGCETVSARAAYVPAVVAPTLHVREQDVDGVLLRVVSSRPLYRAPREDARGLESLQDLSRVDVVGDTARVLGEVLLTLRRAGFDALPRSVDVVLVPSRTELAADAPGLVLVSDRLYEIFPLEQVRALHDQALARALFGALIAPSVQRIEPVADDGWANDLRAVLLTDLDTVRRQGELTTTADLIGWAGFHPAIDQLLYAPQVAFVDALFGTVAEPDAFRDNPWRSRRPTARGRRILEHARDLMEEDDFRAWSRALLEPGVGAREALAALDPLAAARLPQWLDSPALEVNYRLGAVRSERLPDGRFRHVVGVEREGAERIEPVEVRVTDRAGNAVSERWDGEGERGEVVVVTPADYGSVTLDPRGRLPQSPALADGHPLRDDTDSLPFRPPIVQGFALSGSATERNITGLLDVVVRRRYDLENTFGLRLTTDPRSTGGLLRYVRGVGRKRDTNSRIGYVSTGIEVDRLHASFSEGGIGGWRVGALLVAGYSDQRFFLDPRRGSALIGSVSAGVVARDQGGLSFTLSPGLRGNYTVPFGLRGTVVFAAAGSWVFGDPLDSQLPGLGGRFYMRAYQSDEVVGRGRFFAVVEPRFTPTGLSDLAWNGLHIVWIREIQLAAFVGGGLVVDALDGREVAFGAEVGGGVRVHFDYGGIQPGVLAVDLAAPLIRTEQARATRAPVTFILGFEQFF